MVGEEEGGKKNANDLFAKKYWYDIQAPSIFNTINVGKTLVTRTQGKKSAAQYKSRKMFLMPVDPFEPNKSCYVCSKTPLTLVVNTHRSKLRDTVDKIVKEKLGMNFPLLMHGSLLLYEAGEDLEEDEVTNYVANLEKMCYAR